MTNTTTKGTGQETGNSKKYLAVALLYVCIWALVWIFKFQGMTTFAAICWGIVTIVVVESIGCGYVYAYLVAGIFSESNAVPLIEVDRDTEKPGKAMAEASLEWLARLAYIIAFPAFLFLE
jgi:hypothetical protein